MNNQMTTTNSKDLPIHNHSQGEFRNLMSHFWNMLDFSQNHNLADIEPKIEVSENKNNVTVSAELPGIAEQDIDLQISSDGYLTIAGEKKHETSKEEEGSYFSEMSYGMFRRTIPLPWDLDYNKADAEYSDGILKIAIPKTQIEKQKTKKISVKKKK